MGNKDKERLINELKFEDNIDVSWDVYDEWFSLSYEQKLEHYWLFKHDDTGKRVSSTPKMQEYLRVKNG